MPKNDEGQTSRSLDHLSRFETHWEDLGSTLQIFFPAFCACVTATSIEKSERGRGCSQEGKVYVAEAEWFNAADHYTEFQAAFQTYKLTKRRRALRVYGAGSQPPENKMAEPYVYDSPPIK
ncbi:MAG: hypothetical protein JOY92_16265 [Verrucomicrobia bacterium]|nr:hypothetical protein [Verrucomicrobiota bacterium]